ncbi:RHS repeat domain-containing protein, partial [Pseudomonas sp. xss_2]|uniref:RHS repeat domain-containing protein n=1 Tax=Pseudomonas sp. xss_2 TaxID=3367215 RepID=UPI00370C355C
KGEIGGDRKETVLITTQTITGFDDTRKTLTHEHSLNHGQPLLSEDDNGVQIRYEYDALQRVTKEIVAPNLEAFRAAREYSYALCATDKDQASQTLVNARGISTVTQLDGLARGILETRDHIDERSPGQPYTLQTLDYTAEGEIAKREQRDYLPDATTGALEPYPLISSFAYDDWGQLSCTTRPDQVQEHTVFDPIGDSRHKGVKLTTWTQAHGTSATKSRQRETWLDAFERTVRVRRLSATGALESEQSRVQDGLGNCTQYTNERRGKTTYAYDAWMRLSSTTLPNNNEIKRYFAPHSPDELVAKVEMIDKPGTAAWSLGIQAYDHMGRLTEVNVAGRVQTHVYEGGQRFPSSTKTADGKSLTYDYDLALSDAPKGVTSEEPLDSASFEFNPNSALLTKAVNRHGAREYDYAPDNQLTCETWRDANGSVVETHLQHSPMGRLISRTHTSTLAAGKAVQTLSSQFSYNKRGQLVGIEQDKFTSTFTYDTHGRLQTLLSLDGSGKQAKVTITYDDHDREKLRTLASTGQSNLTLSQEWGLDGLLMQRVLKTGTSTPVLQEDFTYDANGRIHTIRYSGNQLPRDDQKRAITKQTFAFDELANMNSCESEFSGGVKETATFHYDAVDRFQLLNISYVPKRQLQAADIQYDGNGCQTTDLAGRLYRYDSLGRLLSITSPASKTTTYRYDANGHLVARAQDDDETLFSHEGNRLSLAVKGAVMTALVYHGTQPIAQQSTDSSLPILLHTNASHSVIAEYQGGQQHPFVYDAYGAHDGDDLRMSLLGYNGEYLDPEHACYPLGRGLRFYFPGDRRFRQADPVGLTNAVEFARYGYCKGNPVMLLDPSGRTATPLFGSLEQNRMAYQSLEMTPHEEEVWGLEIEQRRLEREQKKKITGSMWAAIGIGALFTVLAVVSAGAAVVGAVGAAAAATAGTATAAAATKAMIVAGISVVVAAAAAVSFVADTTAAATKEPWAVKFSQIAGYFSAGVSLFDGLAVKYLADIALKQSMRQSLRRGVRALVASSAKAGTLNYSTQEPGAPRS